MICCKKKKNYEYFIISFSTSNVKINKYLLPINQLKPTI